MERYLKYVPTTKVSGLKLEKMMDIHIVQVVAV